MARTFNYRGESTRDMAKRLICRAEPRSPIAFTILGEHRYGRNDVDHHSHGTNRPNQLGNHRDVHGVGTGVRSDETRGQAALRHEHRDDDDEGEVFLKDERK